MTDLEISPSWRGLGGDSGTSLAGERRMSLGPYPEVSGWKEDAREARDCASRSPPGPPDRSPAAKFGAVRQQQREHVEAIAREWHQMYWGRGMQDRRHSSLGSRSVPWIGSQPISSLKPLNVFGDSAPDPETPECRNCTPRMFAVAEQDDPRHAVVVTDVRIATSQQIFMTLPAGEREQRRTALDPKAVGALISD